MDILYLRARRLLVLGILLVLIVHVNAQDIEMLTFEENCPVGVVVKPKDTAKKVRLSNSHRGKIVYDFVDANMPDSLKLCMKIAAELWGCYLSNEDSLYLKVCYDNNNVEGQNAADISLSVYYIADSTTIFYPSCLLRKKNGLETPSRPDAIIHINNTTDWHLGIGRIGSNSKNLTYALMRAIGTTLGFGSSVKTNKNSKLKFYCKQPTVFDNIVFSVDGEKLGNVKNDELEDFIKSNSGKLYAYKQSEAYKLYTPEQFDENLSLKYLTNQESLMFYDLPKDTVDLIVDDVTMDILNAIGWEIKSVGNVVIACDDIDATGIASAYKIYTFYLKANRYKISEYDWMYRLPLKNGGYEIVAYSKEKEFTIPSIDNESKYLHTMEGDIAGEIVFEGRTTDGNLLTNTYNLTIELKPHILNVTFLSITPNESNEYFCDVAMNVQYEGCHSVHTTLVEEGFSTIRTGTSTIPYTANFYFKNVNFYDASWVEINVSNEYGTESKIFTIPYSVDAKKSTQKAPSKPILKEVEFFYTDFNFETLLFSEPMYVKIKFETENAEHFYLMATESGVPRDEENYFIAMLADKFVQDTGENTYILKIDYPWDWQQKFKIYVFNDYGEAYSDSVYTCDYVTDSNVVKALEEYDDVKLIELNGQMKIHVESNMLTVLGDGMSIVSMTMTNLQGMVAARSGNGVMDISNVPRGIYVLTIKQTNKKDIIKKVKI